MKASFWKGVLKYALGLGLLAGVIAWYWSAPEGSGPGLSDALAKPVQVAPLLLAGVSLAAGQLVTFARWWMLVRAVGLPFPLTSALRLGLVGYYFNTLLPGAVGGDIIKAVAIARGQSRRAVAVATVLIDRAIGLWGLVWLVALLGGAFWLAGSPTLLDNAGLVTIVRSAWAIVVVSAVAWELLGLLPEWRAQRFARRLAHLHSRFGHILAESWRSVWLYRKQQGAVALALALSLVCHTFNVLVFHFASRVFVDAAEAEVLPGLAEHFVAVPVGLAVQAGFPTPGGVGAGEATFAWLYRDVLHRPGSLGVLASLAYRALSWALGLVGYLLYLRMKPSLPVGHAHPSAAAVATES